jgi:multiple sugar transport system ATP-binding protein
MSLLTLENLSKQFGNTVAVDSVNLEVGDPELVVLVGPSGCGKTTTLRMIAGLEDPTEGVIRIDGAVVNRTPPKDRDIAMVFQHYALYPHLNVYRNMAFGLRMRRAPRVEIERRVREAASRLAIEDLLDRKPGELSGGQRQRVALGRAIVRQPKIFLFDEPLSHLDGGLRVAMRNELVRLQRRLETSMLHVTHDQVEAMTMGERIVVMNHGQVQQIGSPDTLYDAPSNQFVAEFIGSPPMNFLPGRITIRNDATVVDLDDFALKIPDRCKHSLEGRMEQNVTLGIRPEHIRITGPINQGWERMGTQVTRVQDVGAQTLLDLQCGRHALATRVDSPSNLRPGDTFDVFLDMANCHFFDPASGCVID